MLSKNYKYIFTFFSFIIISNIYAQNKTDYKIKIISELKPSNEHYSTFQNNYPRLHNIEIDNNGNTYMVDRRRKSILKFDEQFSYVKTIGRHGQGPGEFPNSPSSIAFLNDKMFVLDYSGRISIFDHSSKQKDKFIRFTQSSEISGDKGITIERIKTNQDNIYLQSMTFRENKQKKFMEFGNSVYSSDNDLKLGKEIVSNLREYNPRNMESEKKDLIYVVKKNGNILVSKYSKKEFLIYEYDKLGKKIRTIRKNYAIKKRDSKHVNEINKSNERKAASHSTINKRYKFEKYSEYKTVINQMFLDKDENLWVGVEESFLNSNFQIFDIFDNNGEFIKRVEIPELKGMLLKNSSDKIIAITSEGFDSENGLEVIVLEISL